jgi:hypothetical protein
MDRDGAVARLAYLVTPGKLADLAGFLRTQLPDGLPPQVAYEIVLQSYLFFGYPQAIESLRIFSATAAKLGLTWQARDDALTAEAIRRRGEDLCRRIYSPNYEQLVGNMRLISAELSDWMISEGYGRVLSRPGPESIEREIASIVFLSCSQHPVQLFSHVRGARNLGAGSDRLIAAVRAAGLTADELKLAISTIERVFGL